MDNREFEATATEEPPADRRCEGCDQPASDVGVLTPVRVTFRRGGSAAVRYCADCLDLAEASTTAPGQSDGARTLSIHIKSVERLPYSRPARASSMPRAMRESEILAEYEDGNARVLAEMDFGNPIDAFRQNADVRDALAALDSSAPHIPYINWSTR